MRSSPLEDRVMHFSSLNHVRGNQLVVQFATAIEGSFKLWGPARNCLYMLLSAGHLGRPGYMCLTGGLSRKSTS